MTVGIEWLNFVIDILQKGQWPAFVERKQFINYLDVLFSELKGVQSLSINMSEHKKLIAFFNDSFVPNTSIEIVSKKTTFEDPTFEVFWWIYQTYMSLRNWVNNDPIDRAELLEKIFDMSPLELPCFVKQDTFVYTVQEFDKISQNGPTLVEMPKEMTLKMMSKLCQHNFMTLNGVEPADPDAVLRWATIYLSWVCFTTACS